VKNEDKLRVRKMSDISTMESEKASSITSVGSNDLDNKYRKLSDLTPNMEPRKLAINTEFKGNPSLVY